MTLFSAIASFASSTGELGDLPCCASWTWAEVKVPTGVGGVSRLAPADWPWPGSGWYVLPLWGWWRGQRVVKPSAAQEQTDGDPNAPPRWTVEQSHHRGGGSFSEPKAPCNFFQFEVAGFFLATVIFGGVDAVHWAGVKYSLWTVNNYMHLQVFFFY